MAYEYENQEKECKKEYKIILEDLSKFTNQKIKDYQNNITLIEQKLQKKKEELLEIENTMSLAIEANKKALEEKDKIKFYCLNLSDQELLDIAKMRSIAPMLSNREPFDKLIWKTYYEKPTVALLGKIVGEKTKCGIYKITNLENNMCYIGQSVDIATRLRAHIKAGLGIDSSNNKFYSALKEFGVENFKYEILEECDRPQLNEKEKYWIKYFQSDTFGYNSTKGNN